MNDVPRDDAPSDDIDDVYRRASAEDPARPSDAVRHAVLTHAAQLAGERGVRREPVAALTRPHQRSRRRTRYLSSIVGTLAAAGLIALLVSPRFLLTPQVPSPPPRASELKPRPSTPVASSRAAAPIAAPTTVMGQAAERDDIPTLQTLFDQGMDINARDANGRTPLMLAVMSGQEKAVDALLAHGADVTAADRNGTTPLQAAESAHRAAIAAALRRAGAH